MFTSRGVSIPRRSTQPRSVAGSSASPPNTTSRSASGGEPASSSARTSWRKAPGVWLSTVTRSSASSRRKASGLRET